MVVAQQLPLLIFCCSRLLIVLTLLWLVTFLVVNAGAIATAIATA